MKATDIITRCDNLKPNVQSYAQKRKWLNKIESDIRKQAARYSSHSADTSFEHCEDPELFLDSNHSDIYVYYLISMIDLANQEYALYNNSSSFFNAALTEWQKEYRRTHCPECSVSVKI